MQIGPYVVDNPVVLAPMAGVTDAPFRRLCRQLGAGLVVSEMVTSKTELWESRKSSGRLVLEGEPEPRSVQIAGNEPRSMADAARAAVARGAQIVDINMGCPAKKVCHKAAGSALLRDLPLVRDILAAVVDAVGVPVTLKYRLGWDAASPVAVEVAGMAESVGIAALAVHGRYRSDGYAGRVDYDSIACVKRAVSIPVLANGDIGTPEQARQVLEQTGADGVMIGRAAQGNPWIFREVGHYLRTGEHCPPPGLAERRDVLFGHVRALHAFYGEYLGVRIARKHVGWYLQTQPDAKAFRSSFNPIEDAQAQLQALEAYFCATQYQEEAA